MNFGPKLGTHGLGASVDTASRPTRNAKSTEIESREGLHHQAFHLGVV